MGVIAKQSIRGTVITYAGVFVGFLTTFFVLTRFLTAEEIGLARVLIDAATLFIALAQLGTTTSIIRFYPYFNGQDTDEDETDEHGFFFWTILVPLLGFALFTGLFCALHGPLSAYFGEKSELFVKYYYMVLPLAFFMLYQNVFETNAIVRMRIVFPRAVRELFVRIGLLTVYLLYAFRYIDLDGFVISLCVVYALAMIANIIYLFSIGRISLRPDLGFLRSHPELVRQYLTYTLFLLLSSLATVLAPYLSSFILTARQGLSQTGIFAIATYVAYMVSIPSRSVTSIASPQLAAALKNNNRAELSTLTKQVSNNLFLIGVVILLVIYINLDLFFHILPQGEVYAAGKKAVILLMLAQLLIATFSFSTITLNYSRHYYLSLIYSLLLTLGAIALNNYFIPLWGLTGAGAASLLAYLAYYIIILCTIAITTHTTPLSVGMLKTVLLGSVVVGSNWLWSRFMPPLNIWWDAILRTIIFIIPLLVIACVWQISPDLNRELTRYLPRFKRHS